MEKQINESQISYNRCLRKTDFYSQIETAGFEAIREVIMDKKEIEDSDDSIYKSIEIRINELIELHPRKKELFLGYLKSQEYENYMLEKELITGTWLLKQNQK